MYRIIINITYKIVYMCIKIKIHCERYTVILM